jgi:hypothetical protein
MDNFRGQFPENEEAQDTAQDFDVSEDEVVGDLPPAAIGQDERRMQVRAYNFWASLLGERQFPSSDDFDPRSQADFGPFSVLLDFTGEIENPRVSFLGDKLAQECGSSQNIEYLSDVPSRSLLSRITDHYLQIIANQAPIGFEAEFVNQRGATILYRGILLPFSSDDQTIDFIYGVINWKELADQQTADELLLQIDQVLETKRQQAGEDLPMTAWADGPVEPIAEEQLAAEQFGAEELPILDLDTPLEPGDAFPAPVLAASEAVSPLRHSLLDMAQATPALSDTERTLGDWLATARDQADEAAHSEQRTHQALYAAIGTAYDFALAASEQPAEYAAILADAGLAVLDRAPMTPVVKLVFGIGYDKTRLAEYTAALEHARRLDLPEGGLSRLLGEAPGGLKALVAEERRLRKLESGKADSDDTRHEALARKLRAMLGHDICDISTSGAEFTLLVARRTPGGPIEILGEVDDDPALIVKAARRIAR